MNESDDQLTPFLLPRTGGESASETFGERLRRRREELVSGDDAPPADTWQSRSGTLVALVVGSPHAAASITRKRSESALEVEGVVEVLFAEDLPPFRNTLGHEFSAEPLLAEDEVHYFGQPVALVVGSDETACRRGAAALSIDYHPSPGVVDLGEASAMDSYHGTARKCERNRPDETLTEAPMRLSGEFLLPPQTLGPCLSEGILVRRLDGGAALEVVAEALLPTSVRTAVALAATMPESNVRLAPVALPGIASALETAPARLAALAAHAVLKCRRSVRLLPGPRDSPLVTGTRHAMRASFEVGFEESGKLLAVDLRLDLDGGWYREDSGSVLDRALLHADAVYAVPHFRVAARLCRTNRAVASCAPAEGAAQGAWAMEEIVERVAEAVNRPPHEVREANFYREDEEPSATPYGQPVQAASLHRVWNQALRRSDYLERLEAVEQWNRKNPGCKRGLSIIPAKFGVGDPRAERNAAAVVMQVHADGSVTVRVGVVDLDDGLDGQIRDEVVERLGVERDRVHVVLNDFDALPTTVAVCGTDAAGLVLRAIAEASGVLVQRLREVALQLFAARGQTEIELESIRFAKGLAGPDVSPQAPLHFREVVEGAWRKRVNLVAVGYQRTPNLWWDAELGAGWPFSSFVYAAALTEIQIDTYTGEVQLLSLDAVHEGSPSPDQGERDRAQLVRAYGLGAAWLLCEGGREEDGDDRPAREGGAREDLLGFADAPLRFRCERLRPLGDPASLAGAPCAEAPLLLAVGVRHAVAHALRSFGLVPELETAVPLPATPRAVLGTFREISRRLRAADEGESAEEPETASVKTVK